MADDVVVAIVAEFPLVRATVRDYDSGAWMRRVEFAPPTPTAVPIWLVVNADCTFVVAAGESYRWQEEFIPELREPQTGVIIEEILDLARGGLVAVRQNAALGVYSTTVVGTRTDEAVLAARAGRLARVLEEYDAWS